MAASKFLVVALFAAVAVTTCRAADRINIDRKTLKHMTHAVGVDGFLEVNERATTQKGFQAEPVDIESGEFEIKCATSCDFVKKGAPFFPSSPLSLNGGGALGDGAMAAADEIKRLYDQQSKIEQGLKVAPDDKELMDKKRSVEAQIKAQTLILQAAGGGGVGGSVPPQEEAKRLADAQTKLEALEKDLQANPDDPQLKAERDKLKTEVKAKNEALLAAAEAEKKRRKLDDDVAGMSKRLAELREKATKMPNDPVIANEMKALEKDLSSKASQASALSPKDECYRVCVHPSVKASESDPAHTNNCVRMCVKVMRMLVYKMAKKFL